MSKEPQGDLISMQLPQMSIVSIQLAMGSVDFLTCLILAASTVALTTVKSKPVAYCEYSRGSHYYVPCTSSCDGDQEF